MESGKLDFDLEGVPVRVTNINFDGLGRTKGDFVASAVGDVFKAKSFGELILRVGQAQDNLKKLEIFRDVGTIIDVDKPANEDPSVTGVKSNDDAYQVTFVVKEFSRVAASAKTQMGSQADAQLKVGIRMPNMLGRGEKFEVEYSYSSSEERNTEVSFMKPLIKVPNANIKGSLFHTKSTNVQTSYMNNAVGSLITLYCRMKDAKLRTIHHKLEYEGTWRELTPAKRTTPLSVRCECGHSFKSAIRHILTVEGRDQTIFPNSGFYANFLHELAGLFGDVKYHKFDIDLQHNMSIIPNTVFQTSFRVGLITPFGGERKTCGLADRFFSGGPYSLRGFNMRGINVGEEGISLGGLAYWSSAVHMYSRLPFLNRKFPMVDNCRLHFFANAGNLADKLLSGNVLNELRVATGVGLAVALGNFGRLEVNYCWPIRHDKKDSFVKGIQVGVGVHFI